MCFSSEVSLGTFVFSWAASLYVINTRSLNFIQLNNVYLLMIFSSMQLVDFILWSIKMKKNYINYFVTSIVVPLILSAMLFFNALVFNKGKNMILNIVSFIGSIYLFYRFNGYSKSVCENKLSSPVWASKEVTYSELIIYVTAIFYPIWKHILFAVFVIFPFLFVISNGAYGSLWCTISNLAAVYYLFAY